MNIIIDHICPNNSCVLPFMFWHKNLLQAINILWLITCREQEAQAHGTATTHLQHVFEKRQHGLWDLSTDPTDGPDWGVKKVLPVVGWALHISQLHTGYHKKGYYLESYKVSTSDLCGNSSMLMSKVFLWVLPLCYRDWLTPLTKSIWDVLLNSANGSKASCW